MRDRHNRVKELFLRAREISLDQRTAWLLEACGRDAVLRGEVESLLIAEKEMPTEYLQPSAGLDLLPGSRVSRYRILDHLGTGGMGEVWLAHDETLDRRVALKFPAADRLRDFSARRRLRREARVAAALDHPAICRVFELGEFDGQVFIAMEYIEGETMAARLARGRVPFAQALSWGAQIAAALEEAHGKGIVHRDLKPANVMITASGVIKVMDFGLARTLPGALTRDGTAWSSGLSAERFRPLRRCASRLDRDRTLVGNSKDTTNRARAVQTHASDQNAGLSSGATPLRAYLRRPWRRPPAGKRTRGDEKHERRAHSRRLRVQANEDASQRLGRWRRAVRVAARPRNRRPRTSIGEVPRGKRGKRAAGAGRQVTLEADGRRLGRELRNQHG
jgi:predicted Ser/Thr protein kinase/ribosomal protein S10